MAALTPLMEEILAQGASVEITVTGNSMRPLLFHRSSRVRLASATNVKRGDVPLYRRDNGAYVLHRVVSCAGETYTCCGDNQWVLEPGIRPDQIVAVMTHFTRGNRWICCDHCGYRMYWRFWVCIRPLRRWIIGGSRRVKQMVKRILFGR